MNMVFHPANPNGRAAEVFTKFGQIGMHRMAKLPVSEEIDAPMSGEDDVEMDLG